jgi:hypothetical protein
VLGDDHVQLLAVCWLVAVVVAVRAGGVLFLLLGALPAPATRLQRTGTLFTELLLLFLVRHSIANGECAPTKLLSSCTSDERTDEEMEGELLVKGKEATPQRPPEIQVGNAPVVANGSSLTPACRQHST